MICLLYFEYVNKHIIIIIRCRHTCTLPKPFLQCPSNCFSLESRFIDWVRYQHLPNHPNGLPPNRTKKEPFPLWLNFTKGSAHVTLSRAFVEFVLYNPLSLQLFQWMRDTFVPDETYLSTLSHNPLFKAPGGYTGELGSLYPNKHKTLSRCGFNPGTASPTVGQH